MNYKISLTIISITFLFISCKLFTSEQINYLNIDSVKSKYQKHEYKESTRQKALIHLKKGIHYHNKKAYKEAIDEFVTSLNYEIRSETFYHYGNSLSSLHKYEDSIKSYKIALELNKGWMADNKQHYNIELPKKYIPLLYYNIACSFGLQNNTSESFEYIIKALLSGYNSYSYILGDSDLVNLRKSPNWNEYKYKIQLIIEGDPNIIVNHKVIKRGPSSVEEYYFYDNNEVVFKSYCDPETELKGKWEIKNLIVTINFYHRKQKIGKGKYRNCSACNCEYENYETVNTDINENDTIDLSKIETDSWWWEKVKL